LQALQALTHTVPLVGMTEDMVAAGLVKSLAHPGGNTTGISLLSPELDGKRQDILIEMVSAAHRIADIRRWWSDVRFRCNSGHRLTPLELLAWAQVSFVGTFWGTTPTGLYVIVRTRVFYVKGGHSLRQIMMGPTDLLKPGFRARNGP
jgi:hypothetical protein